MLLHKLSSEQFVPKDSSSLPALLPSRAPGVPQELCEAFFSRIVPPHWLDFPHRSALRLLVLTIPAGFCSLLCALHSRCVQPHSTPGASPLG